MGVAASKRGLVGRKWVLVAGNAWQGVKMGPCGSKTRADGSVVVGKGCRRRGVSKGVVVGRNARPGCEIRGWGGLINVIK